MSVAVRRAASPRELAAALDLRVEVFCGEQGVAIEEEVDGRDGDAVHLVALDGGERVVGTCRLFDEGATMTLGRMAVAIGARRRGVASLLLARAEDEARAAGAERIALGAQLLAVSLYERSGYVVTDGEPYLDAGIEHVRMEKIVG